jgi:hypothetical protein
MDRVAILGLYSCIQFHEGLVNGATLFVGKLLQGPANMGHGLGIGGKAGDFFVRSGVLDHDGRFAILGQHFQGLRHLLRGAFVV